MSKNIVIFGETGVGKSSVINLMAGKVKAKTSPDMQRCTLNYERHDITFDDGHSYKVFDTVGLEELQLGMKEYLNIIENAYDLITRLQKEGGIDLLLFCIRAGRISATIQTNYRLFYEWLCEKKVPIVLVVTGLEREENMEDWWIRNKPVFGKYGIDVAGHACITAADNLDGRHRQLYETSRSAIRELVINYANDKNTSLTDSGLFDRMVLFLKRLLLGSAKKKKIVEVLTKRCHMPREAAEQLALNIKSKTGVP